MFVDYVKVNIKAGDGGNGCVAFRREKYVPLGGPAGGNGGDGGNVIFKATENVSTLVSLRYNSLIKSGNGEHGKGSSMHGKNCEDTIILVPIGTVVRDVNSGQVLADLVEENQEQVICYGGKGGRGNKFFKSNSNKAPTISEKGDLGEEKTVIVELKLLADVGLVGLPSVGKSTFISMVTNVKPKIAEYPFTTLVPNLGVAQTKDGRGSFLFFADLFYSPFSYNLLFSFRVFIFIFLKFLIVYLFLFCPFSYLFISLIFPIVFSLIFTPLVFFLSFHFYHSFLVSSFIPY